MNRIVALIAAAACAGYVSCTHEAEHGSIEALSKNLSSASSYHDLRRIYTRGTLDAIDAAASQMGIAPDKMILILPRFGPLSQWDELSRKIEGDTAHIRIRFTRHPVENLIGFSLDLTLKKEREAWRIDFEDEVKRVFTKQGKDAAAEYLRKMGRNQ